MKTTLDIDDDLLSSAKRRAAAAGMSLKAFVEEALRARLLASPARAPRFTLDLPMVVGGAPPAVDPADRDSLYDFMEGRA